MVGLGELPGGEVESIATGISADGSAIVGGSGSGSSAGPEAFRWTATDGMVGLGGLPGNSVVSGAHGVSADGSVVVGHALKSFSPVYGAEVPFRWTQAGGMVDLGPMPEGTAGFASAASGDGSVVVGDAGNAFRWTEGSGMVGLGNTPSEAFTHTVAWDVSADGSVIVGNGSTANGAAAFIWDSNHGMRLLRDVLVNDYGLDLIGWDLSSASAVSADGRTIVGGGINPSGLQEAWIAVLPEPSTGLLFALGLAGFAGSRRRFV